MMIKYRVREVAKDLNLTNKDVIDTLAKYFTQERNLASLDEYFAQRELGPEPKREQEPEASGKKPAEPKPAPAKEGGKKQVQPKDKEAPKGQPAPAAAKPAAEQQAGQKSQQKSAQPVREPKAPTRRVVDTRSSNVNIDKYNEKYDRLADQKVSARQDNAVTKQKGDRGRAPAPHSHGAQGKAYHHRGARRDKRWGICPAP